ncbi:hypothetical protein AALP_AA8G458700 [Arabis alpina]|uniref:Uncharacterized protein n=1 Tax=Arabis alpina TaxID=50452 RepID=A0A087GDP8_ARAAL|nr:hypothetical protein AALP_AA8G458700 [Arabis alpina]
MQTSRLLSFSSNSPSFGSFSSTVDLTAIAARVVEEFQNQEPNSDSQCNDDEDDSDFAFDCPSHICSQPIATADEIFCNGQIRPLNPYAPVNIDDRESQPPQPRRRRPALGKLMSEDRDPSSNSLSETEEDLTGVPPESYCVWKPKQSNDDELSSSPSQSQSKIKSNSAGFSKRWKLRNILYARSSSEGGNNEKLVFPAPVKKDDESTGEEEKTTSLKEEEEERESEETKRQSFVPYKKDMIGILKNVNGLSRHLRPF